MWKSTQWKLIFILAQAHDLVFTSSDFVCDKKHVLGKIWFFKNGYSALHKHMPMFPVKLCNSCLHRNPQTIPIYVIGWQYRNTYKRNTYNLLSLLLHTLQKENIPQVQYVGCSFTTKWYPVQLTGIYVRACTEVRLDFTG